MNVPLLDRKTQYRPIRGEILAAIEAACDCGCPLCRIDGIVRLTNPSSPATPRHPTGKPGQRRARTSASRFVA